MVLAQLVSSIYTLPETEIVRAEKNKDPGEELFLSRVLSSIPSAGLEGDTHPSIYPSN